VNLLSVPGIREGPAETYDDVRESHMIPNGGSGPRDTGEYRINSTDYNQLFSDKNVSKKTAPQRKQLYNTIDAHFQRNNTLVTLSEFPYDDCYANIQSLKRLRRISKSCSDIRAVLEKPYVNILSSCDTRSMKDNSDKDVLVEHL
jgi:hypothetical protein